MSRNAIAIAGAALLAAAATTTLSAAAGATNAPARTHTQHFQAMATAQVATSKATFVLAERDVVGSKVIGHDVLFCRSSRTQSTCQLAIAETGGLLYARFRLRDSDHTLHGSVTGGTGRYRHARGTITGRMLSASDVRVALRYQV